MWILGLKTANFCSSNFPFTCTPQAAFLSLTLSHSLSHAPPPPSDCFPSVILLGMLTVFIPPSLGIIVCCLIYCSAVRCVCGGGRGRASPLYTLPFLSNFVLSALPLCYWPRVRLYVFGPLQSRVFFFQSCLLRANRVCLCFSVLIFTPFFFLSCLLIPFYLSLEFSVLTFIACGLHNISLRFSFHWFTSNKCDTIFWFALRSRACKFCNDPFPNLARNKYLGETISSS